MVNFSTLKEEFHSAKLNPDYAIEKILLRNDEKTQNLHFLSGLMTPAVVSDSQEVNPDNADNLMSAFVGP